MLFDVAGVKLRLVRVNQRQRREGTMNRVFVGLMLAVFLGAVAAPTLAQQGTADIGGRATGEQGTVVPGVMIVLTNGETGVVRQVMSGEDGRYCVSALTAGRYGLAATLASVRHLDWL